MNTNLRRLLPLLLLIFIDSFSYFVVIPVLLQVFYHHQYGLLPSDASQTVRNTVTGFTIALSTFASLIAAPLIGNFSDKYGRKKVLLLCLSGVILGFLLPIIGILQKNIFLFLLGRFIGGVGSASQPIAQAAVADLCEGKEKAFFLSLIALMMTLPIILGPLAGGYLSDSSLISWFSVTTPYWFALLISLLIFILISLFFKETLAEHHSHVPILSIKEVILSASSIAKKYHIGYLLLILFFLEFGWSQYYQSIPMYLIQQFHYSAQHVSLFYTYMGILMSLSLMILYPILIRSLEVKRILVYSIILVLIGLVGCALFYTATIQWIFIPLVAIFTGTAYVSLLTLISNQVPTSNQGWAMGFSSTVLFLAWMITGFMSGGLISLYAKLPLYLSAVALVVACIVLFRLKKKI